MPWTNPLSGRRTSGFNLYRRHPVTGAIQPHRGSDVAPNPGYKYVGAIGSGTVLDVRTNSYRGDRRQNTIATQFGTLWFGTGNYVLIHHGNGIMSYSSHLHTVLVSPGQFVGGGQAIGRVGATGVVTGVHLHLEILLSGWNHVNPVTWLSARGVSLGYGRTSVSTGPVIPASAYPSVQMKATPLVFTFEFTTPRIG